MMIVGAARTREGCDRSSEVGTVYIGRDGEGPVSLRKPKESGRTVVRKLFVAPDGDIDEF